MKNKLFYSIILLFLSSCFNNSESNIEIISDFKTYNISGDIVIKGNDDLIISQSIIVTDSLLTVINVNKQDTLFYVYDLNNFEIIRTFGRRGNGPNDFLFPMFYNNILNQPNTFQVFDVNTLKSSTIYQTFDSLSIASERLPQALVGAFNMSKIKDTIYYGIKAGDTDLDGLFFIYNKINGKLKWAKYLSEKHEDIKSPNKFNIYYNYLSVNEEKNLVIIALRYFNKILYYDLEGKPLKEYQIGDKELFPKWNYSNNDMDNSSVTYFLDMCVTDEFIYCLWVDYEEETEKNAKIFVFNWDMRYIATLQLDKPVWRIKSSKNNQNIFAITDDGTGLSDIIKYDISNILN